MQFDICCVFVGEIVGESVGEAVGEAVGEIDLEIVGEAVGDIDNGGNALVGAKVGRLVKVE